jgi:hypothetical protein
LKKKLVHITLDNGAESKKKSKTLHFQEIKMFSYDIPPTVIWLGVETSQLKDIKRIAISTIDGKELLSGRINWKRIPLNIQNGVSFEVL